MDLLVLALLTGAAVLGWRRGLCVSLVAALVFVAVGLPVAAVAAAIGSPPPIVAFLLGGLIGVVPLAIKLHLVTTMVNESLGPTAKLIDRIGGAAINTAFSLVLAWFVAALASVVPTDTPILAAVRDSSSLGALVATVPPQGGLGVVVLRSGLVPGLNGPLVLAEEPDTASVDAPGVLAARTRVFEIRGNACDKLVTGSGWLAGDGLVVTNAHVVAGVATPYVAVGPRVDGVPGRVTAFDPVNDVAVIAVDLSALGLTPLPIVDRVEHGERAAIVGFPKGGELQLSPARVDRVATYAVQPVGGVQGGDATIFALRGLVRPGNSGGPILAEDGSVLGMVVAQGLGQRVDATYGVASRQLRVALAAGSAREPASSGPCLEEGQLGPGRATR